LGHIIVKEGVKIDPKRVESINNISIPKNRKEVYTFLVIINILRRFIPNYAEIVKEITKMLKKDKELKWTIKARESFYRIKKYFTEASVLYSPYSQRPFLILSFASPNMVASLLLQKNNEG